MKKNVISVILSLFICEFGFAQDNKTQPVILPSILVIPRVKKDESLQDLIDKSDEIRVGMAAVNSAFLNNDFDVKDFETVVKRIEIEENINSCELCSIKEFFFNHSSADLLVELDMVFVKDAAGNKIRMPIEANNFSSTKPWAVKIIESNYIRTTDVASLVTSAINQKFCEDNDGNSISCINKFIQEIKEYQIRICEVGNSAALHFKIHEDSEYRINTPLPQADNTRLGFVIEDWLESTSFNSYYKVDNSTLYQLIVEDYRFDCKSTSSRIRRKLTRFFDDLEIQVEISQDQSILYITIL